MFHLIISADTAEIFVQLFKINEKFCISVHVTYIFASTLQCLLKNSYDRTQATREIVYR